MAKAVRIALLGTNSGPSLACRWLASTKKLNRGLHEANIQVFLAVRGPSAFVPFVNCRYGTTANKPNFKIQHCTTCGNFEVALRKVCSSTFNDYSRDLHLQRCRHGGFQTVSAELRSERGLCHSPCGSPCATPSVSE